MDNIRFHRPPTCILQEHLLTHPHNYTGNFNMPVLWCETHQMIVCHCGWEFGYHLGTESNPTKLPLAYFYDFVSEHLKEKIKLTWRYYTSKSYVNQQFKFRDR